MRKAFVVSCRWKLERRHLWVRMWKYICIYEKGNCDLPEGYARTIHFVSWHQNKNMSLVNHLSLWFAWLTSLDFCTCQMRFLVPTGIEVLDGKRERERERESFYRGAEKWN